MIFFGWLVDTKVCTVSSKLMIALEFYNVIKFSKYYEMTCALYSELPFLYLSKWATLNVTVYAMQTLLIALRL